MRVKEDVIFTLFYCFFDLSYDQCNVISMYFLCCSINGSVCLVCTCLTVFLGVVVILLFNVMQVVSGSGGALLDRPCMFFQRMCVLCL